MISSFGWTTLPLPIIIYEDQFGHGQEQRVERLLYIGTPEDLLYI